MTESLDDERPSLAGDIGGTGARFLLAPGGTEWSTPGVGWHAGAIAENVVRRTVEAWRAFGAPPLHRVALGIAPTLTEPGELAQTAGRLRAATGASEVLLANDAVTAALGALDAPGGSATPWGVAFAAGTGVACTAVDRTGRVTVLDGWGPLLGDGGAGFALGRSGLRAVLRAREGRGAAAQLVAAAVSRFGALQGLEYRLHATEDAVAAIAGFAADVDRIAEADDEVAQRVVADAVAEAHELILDGIAFVSDSPHGVPVGLSGGLVCARGSYSRRLVAGLAEVGARPRIVPRASLRGAVALARRGPGAFDGFVHVGKEQR